MPASIRVTTKKIRMSYPHIWERDQNGKYGLTVLIPQHDRPGDPVPASERKTGIRNVRHGRRFCFAAVPDDFIVPFCDDLISRLPDPAFAVP